MAIGNCLDKFARCVYACFVRAGPTPSCDTTCHGVVSEIPSRLFLLVAHTRRHPDGQPTVLVEAGTRNPKPVRTIVWKPSTIVLAGYSVLFRARSAGMRPPPRPTPPPTPWPFSFACGEQGARAVERTLSRLQHRAARQEGQQVRRPSLRREGRLPAVCCSFEFDPVVKLPSASSSQPARYPDSCVGLPCCSQAGGKGRDGFKSVGPQKKRRLCISDDPLRRIWRWDPRSILPDPDGMTPT